MTVEFDSCGTTTGDIFMFFVDIILSLLWTLQREVWREAQWRRRSPDRQADWQGSTWSILTASQSPHVSQRWSGRVEATAYWRQISIRTSWHKRWRLLECCCKDIFMVR